MSMSNKPCWAVTIICTSALSYLSRYCHIKGIPLQSRSCWHILHPIPSSWNWCHWQSLVRRIILFNKESRKIITIAGRMAIPSWMTVALPCAIMFWIWTLQGWFSAKEIPRIIALNTPPVFLVMLTESHGNLNLPMIAKCLSSVDLH